MIACFGACRLDGDRRELRVGGIVVHVEPQVFDLLAYLIAERDRVVSRDDIVDAVWHGRIVSDATLGSRINAVRHAIGDDGATQALIRTIHRHGFRFVADVREEEAGGPRRPQPGGTGAEVRGAYMANQQVTFCRTADGVRLAVGVVGEGDVLVKTSNWLNHIEFDWESPLWAPSFEHWAAGRRLVRYDQRGTGLSDWDVGEISFEAFLRDLEAVTDALGLQRFALFGISQGGAIALAYAAQHPERVSRIVVHGAYPLGRNRRNTAADREEAAAYLALIRRGWGHPGSAFMRAFSSLYIPEGSAEQIRWYSDLQRVTTSAENAVRIRQACDEIDIMEFLPQVRAPTLVTHCRGDSVVPFDQGKTIASSVAGARFVGLDSMNHGVLPDDPVWPRWLGEIDAFLSGPD